MWFLVDGTSASNAMINGNYPYYYVSQLQGDFLRYSKYVRLTYVPWVFRVGPVNDIAGVPLVGLVYYTNTRRRVCAVAERSLAVLVYLSYVVSFDLRCSFHDYHSRPVTLHQ